ncbi:hypothetical protein QQZ08_009956 [Neonectria magnoliae]|uniref:Mid2 domain-containing protein n=1 Tax=Neonectria magnoliae TaxID=2732573 RepID=A0ABR1HJL1_9HYPO
MQVRGLALLSLVLGAEGTLIVRHQADDDALVRRQDATATDAVDVSSAIDSVIESATEIISDSVDPVTSSTDVEVVTTTSAAPDDDTTSESVPAEVTTTSDGGSSDGGSSDADSTITRTVTVTDEDADTITQKTTVQRTITSTIFITSTVFETETVTSDGETATRTIYETSTTWANEKRAIDLAPRTVDNHGLAIVDAKPTDTPELSDLDLQDLRNALVGRNELVKRATVTKVVTVTVGSDAGKTVVNSVTQTVISTTSKPTKVTKTVTETEAAGASTTVTKTSTLVITSTRVTTGVVKTATVAPTGSYGTAGTGGSDSSDSDSTSSSSSSSSSGLSTGAKAGIGAGCGAVGLAVIGIILWCCLKKRNKPSKSEIDDMFGSSEVPVGGVRGNGTSPHMAQTSPGMDSALVPGRMPTKNSTAEGYRGTALGDGRTGYAKPNTYGSSYNAVSPETQYSRTTTMNTVGREELLPEHHARGEMVSPTTTAAELGNDGGGARWIKSDAAEIDGTQLSSARAASPAEHVYEMPAQPYR